jgi:hypothetical protein
MRAAIKTSDSSSSIQAPSLSLIAFIGVWRLHKMLAESMPCISALQTVKRNLGPRELSLIPTSFFAKFHLSSTIGTKAASSLVKFAFAG